MPWKSISQVLPAWMCTFWDWLSRCTGAFRKGGQELRQLFQGGMVQEGSRFQPQVGSQEMFSKIGLLPAVQGLVKSGLEGKFSGNGQE